MNVSIRVEGIDGSLPFTTSKGCLNLTTRHRVRNRAGSPPSHIRHIQNPTICPRSYALLPAISLNSFTSHSHNSLYAVKAGYPPRALTAVIPELPLSSLGLAPGDQLIVVQKSGSAAAPTLSSPANPGRISAAARPGTTPSSNPRQKAAPTSSAIEGDGPDYVSTDGGYLIHRVRTTRPGHPCHLFGCVRGMSS